MSNQKIILIDAHGLCYRAFYAVRNLANSKGQPTNAVFGFCNTLRKLLRDLQPTYVAACFDVGKETHRQKKFADYKIQRQAMPEGLRGQLPMIKDVLEAYRIPVYEKEGYEADDVIATLVDRLKEENCDIIIASDDKDLAQLTSSKVFLYSPRQEKMLNEAELQERLGVPSSQIIDLIALAGDASDNIPGVDGIGQVGAVKLLNKYGSLDNIYEHLSEITPVSVQEKLHKGKAQAQLSRQLAIVDKDVPLKVTLEDLKYQLPDSKRLFEIFTELEFKKFAQEVSGSEQKEDLFIEEEVFNKTGSFEFKEENSSVTIVYDLKGLRKQFRKAIKGNVFDFYLAQYLLGNGNNRVNGLPASEEKTKKIYEGFKKQLHDQSLDFLLYEVEQPLANVLYEMEESGVQVDVDVLKQLSCNCDSRIKETQDSLFKIAGTEFNINSPKQFNACAFLGFISKTF